MTDDWIQSVLRSLTETPTPPAPLNQPEFGELAEGRWAINTDRDTTVYSRCFRCGAIRPAERLFYRVMPFNRGEGWGCLPYECGAIR